MKPPSDWIEIPYFLAVARSGSLRAAAEICGGTHATVNRHLKALEESYGVRLVERSRNGMTLTPAGESLLPLAETAEAAVLGARRKLDGMDQEAAGEVKLSIPPALSDFLLSPILASFSEAHPEIDLRIRVTNRYEDLTQNEADVSVRVSNSVDDDVHGRRVVRYVSGVYASRSYLARHWDAAGSKGEGLTWIGWGERSKVPQWVKDSPFPRASVRHAVGEGYMVACMVRDGAGMSYLPVMMEAVLPGLVRVPGTPLWEDRSIWVLLHSDLRNTTRVRLLVDHLNAEIRARRKVLRGDFDKR